MPHYTCNDVAGWERYPHNLSFTALDVDVDRCSARLKENSHRLFLPRGERSELLMTDFTFDKGKETCVAKQRTVETFEQLSQGLTQPSNTRLFHITQAFSWDQLLITEELFRKLLTILRVHPGFLDVVHVFGEKITAIEESFATCFTSFQLAPSEARACSYEIAYNVKYVARHGREIPLDPFSIRETGVHQKFRAETSESIWITLNPPKALRRRLAAALTNPEISQPNVQFRFHALILQCLSEDWRDYVNYLESHFSELRDRGFLSNHEQPVQPGKIDVTFDDIRQLQMMTDKFKRLIHLLDLNKQVCERLRAFFNRIKPLSPEQAAVTFEQYDDMMENCISRFTTPMLQLNSLISRAEGIGSMIEHILARRMNSAMHDISRQGAQENKLVARLAVYSARDTNSMRIFALISAIFLPATFVATFFGSNFFGFEENGQGYKLAIASNVWIYIITALVTSVMTVAVWYWWVSRSRVSDKGINDAEDGASASCE